MEHMLIQMLVRLGMRNYSLERDDSYVALSTNKKNLFVINC